MIKKLVLIDDSHSQMKIIKNAFEVDGWEVFEAIDANEALQLIYSCAPDLVITDALMPNIGGFQFLKKIRENEKISKIPVIIYSVLKESHAKFYLKDTKREFFLTKNQNTEELIELAKEAVKNNPIDFEYKTEILSANISFHKTTNQQTITTPLRLEEDEIVETIKEEFKINEALFLRQIKDNYATLMIDEKFPETFFKIVSQILEYDFGILNFYNYTYKESFLNFSIKNFILSPVLQSKLSEKYETKNMFLNKTYSANSKTISNLDEFNSKIEFSFNFTQRETGKIAFYSLEENKWDNLEEIEKFKKILENFFKSRYINKTSANSREESLTNKYLGQIDVNLKNKFNPSTTKIEMYLGIINISNYLDIEIDFNEEEMDLLNSKISEKIMSHLKKDEQIYKTEEDEYTIVLFEDNCFDAIKRFQSISNMLNMISIQDYKLNASIGISNCYIDGIFNIYDAKKQAIHALNQTTNEEKVKYYGKQQSHNKQ